MFPVVNGLYAVLLALGLLSASGLAQSPHVLLISIDDLNDWTGSLNGHPQAHTPNIDRLASEGMRFMQHYTGAPVCAPARCVLLTGKHLAHAEIRQGLRGP